MKLSFMTFACPQWPLDQVIAAAVEHGYHGIEFRIDATHAHGLEVSALPEERRAMRQRLEDHGLAVPCLATSLQFASDRVGQEAPPRLTLAHDLGCRALRVFCGPPPLDGMAQREIVEKVARQLREVAELAGEAGIELWLETHDTFCKAADAAAAVRQAQRPNVGINYDNMHPFRKGESVAASFEALAGLIRHTHFHDALLDPDQVVIKPLGEGGLPMDEMFAALVKAGYEGYLSGEWFGEMYGPTPHEALRRYSQDMQALAERHGVRLERE